MRLWRLHRRHPKRPRRPPDKAAGVCAFRRRTGCSAWPDEWLWAGPIHWGPGGPIRGPRVAAARPDIREDSSFVGAERFGLQLSVFPDQQLYAGFGLFELLAAGFAQRHAPFEQLERSFKLQVAGFQFLDYLFQLVETAFESWRLGFRVVGH